MPGGRPAARLTDMHTCPRRSGHHPHVGGPILPTCEPTVLIGGLPAARVGDPAYCHGPTDMIAQGSPTVFIGGRQAARLGDRTAHSGVIVMGCPTVRIGNAPTRRQKRLAGQVSYAPERWYSSLRKGFHEYFEGPNQICGPEDGCSQNEIVDALPRFAVPGQDPEQPVQSGQRSMVYAPGLDIPVGHVDTFVSEDGTRITNITRPGHIFHDGQVERFVTHNTNGSWDVTTHGIGNNETDFLGLVNQESGPGIFKGVDESMKEYIKQHHSID